MSDTTTTGSATLPADMTPQRLDKWLWFARIVKSRSLAQKLVNGGHVRVNRDKAQAPAKAIRHGDVLTIAVANRILVLKVVAPGTRRGAGTRSPAALRGSGSLTGSRAAFRRRRRRGGGHRHAGRCRGGSGRPRWSGARPARARQRSPDQAPAASDRPAHGQGLSRLRRLHASSCDTWSARAPLPAERKIFSGSYHRQHIPNLKPIAKPGTQAARTARTPAGALPALRPGRSRIPASDCFRGNGDRASI